MAHRLSLKGFRESSSDPEDMLFRDKGYSADADGLPEGVFFVVNVVNGFHVLYISGRTYKEIQ